LVRRVGPVRAGGRAANHRTKQSNDTACVLTCPSVLTYSLATKFYLLSHYYFQKLASLSFQQKLTISIGNRPVDSSAEISNTDLLNNCSPRLHKPQVSHYARATNSPFPASHAYSADMTVGQRTVLITGCSDGGLGAALAIALHKAGLYVYATARSVEKMTQVLTVGHNVIRRYIRDTHCFVCRADLQTRHSG
jgi:hypothetical protein